MKKITTISIGLGIAIASIGFLSLNNSAVANGGGSPGNKINPLSGTCGNSGCHNVTPEQITGWITSDIPSSGYIPGQAYTVTVNAVKAGITKFGFELAAQSGTFPSLVAAGTFSSPSSDAKIITSGSGAGNVTHKSSGWDGSWSAQWTAPSAGTGSILFGSAFVAANGNANPTGDSVFIEAFSVSEDQSSSINDISTIDFLKVFPNPVDNKLTVSFKNKDNTQTLTILSLDGKFVQSLGQVSTSGIFTQAYDVTSLAQGVYVLQITSDKGIVTKKIFKN